MLSNSRVAPTRPAAAVLPPIQMAEPPALKTPPVPTQLPPQPDIPFRKGAFYASLGVLLILFGALPEVFYFITGKNTYALYLVGPPAIIGALLTGSVKRTFRARAPYYWMAFFLWMVLSTPFSSWLGGSIGRVIDYSRLVLLLMFMVGGLAINWKEIRLIFYTIAAAAVINLLTARLFMNTAGGRISLQASTTIGNSNDLAAHLLLVLPFLLFVAFDSKRNVFFRLTLIAPLAYGVWVILGTASRGAVVALFILLIFSFWRASMTQRAALIVGGALITLLLVATLPKSALVRLGGLFGSQQDQEAKESAESRSYLFRKSVLMTIQHPIFGVGPDQFANFEGGESVRNGQHGNWHETHCAFTQVSSECGIPALIFFLAGIGSAFLLVNRTYRAARAQGNVEIARACNCYQMAIVGHLGAAAFLSNAYRFYLPVMIGLAVSMSIAAMQTLKANRQTISPKMPFPAYPAPFPGFTPKPVTR